MDYEPEKLIGKKIIIVKNLKPRKLMGVTSYGMLLAASDENNLSLLVPDKDVKEGSKIS
jgi:methionine--tRNA ligase beta chain